MTKARILANLISDNAELADGQISVAEVVGAAPLANPTFTGNIDAGYNVKIRLGDSDDLQIYHDGNDSLIKDTGTGNLTLTGSAEVTLENAARTQYMLRATDGGDVKLYNAGAAKLATTSTGVDITGDVGGDTATISGTTTTDALDLAAIAATKSDTAVDVFVYDTSKDSDGGAWRKRTQGTSWYNETLNTATRGSRKEFPAVAVIVVDNDGLYIYDGDDPNLPMWMKANDVSSGMLLNGSNANAVTAKNGIIALAASSAFWVMHFVDDRGDLRNSARRYDYKGNIEQRNDGLGYIDQETSGALVHHVINDVAMIVLDNAPIDSATGLPVPTIAIASDGGVSVIRDDGTVTNSAATNAFNHISANRDGFAYGYNSYENYLVVSYEATATNSWSSDIINIYYGGSGGMSPLATAHSSTNATDALAAYSQGNNIGLTNWDVKRGGGAYEKLFNYTTSSYNTGWMNGDIKLATLSDTDDTDVTGAELVTNGTFDSDTSGWTATTGTSLSVDTNRLKVTVNTGGDNAGYQVITTVSGYTYTLSATLQKGSTNGLALIRAGTGVASSAYGSSVAVTSTSATEVSFTFTATGTSTYITAICSNAGNHAFFDNISVRLAEEDRSVNGNGLQVFGSITKDPVASGADLVGYSGFSSSNSLIQPINSDILNLTKRSFVIWSKATKGSGFQYLWTLTDNSNYHYGLAINSTTGVLYSFDQENGAGGNDFDIATGQWHCIVMTDDETSKKLYVNGVLRNTIGHAYDLNSSGKEDMVLRVGSYNSGVYPHQGSLALFRVSGTILSPEQIAKIYEDEKVLFQENAQATLYAASPASGSPDAVTALAYDDSTELLHVGTDNGRSVFQGLRRVDNTTDAVGAAISASNGLVAED